MWMGATADFCLPSSPNHSAILHSAPPLLLPHPRGLPNCSSCHEGPEQVLLCLRLLAWNLISFKEQLRAIRPVLSQLPALHKLLMLNQRPPARPPSEHESISSIRLILPDIPLFLSTPPNSTVQRPLLLTLVSLSHFHISSASASAHLHISPSLNSKTKQSSGRSSLASVSHFRWQNAKSKVLVWVLCLGVISDDSGTFLKCSLPSLKSQESAWSLEHFHFLHYVYFLCPHISMLLRVLSKPSSILILSTSN